MFLLPVLVSFMPWHSNKGAAVEWTAIVGHIYMLINHFHNSKADVKRPFLPGNDK